MKKNILFWAVLAMCLAETGKTMEYNLLVPEGYDGTKSYPLVLFMADASTVNKEVTTI